jgi:hypothetical protein
MDIDAFHEGGQDDHIIDTPRSMSIDDLDSMTMRLDHSLSESFSNHSSDHTFEQQASFVLTATRIYKNASSYA